MYVLRTAISLHIRSLLRVQSVVMGNEFKIEIDSFPASSSRDLTIFLNNTIDSNVKW